MPPNRRTSLWHLACSLPGLRHHRQRHGGHLEHAGTTYGF